MKSSIELFQSLWFKVAGEVFSVMCGRCTISRHTNANETFSKFFQRFLGVCSKFLPKALMSQILHFFWWFQLRYFAYRAWCFSFFVFRLLLGGYFIKRVFADYQWEPHEKTSLSENCLFWVFLGGFMVQNRKQKKTACWAKYRWNWVARSPPPAQSKSVSKREIYRNSRKVFEQQEVLEAS